MPPHGPAELLRIAAHAAGHANESDLDQLAISRDLLDLLDSAATAAGLCRPTWRTDSPARTELSIDEPAALAADRFIRELDAELIRYNLPRQPADRLRMRLTIHYGQSLDAKTYALPLRSR